MIDAAPAIIKAAHFPIAYTADAADADIPCFENAVQEIRATALAMKKQSLADLAAQVAEAIAQLAAAGTVPITPEIRANLLAAAQALLDNANVIAEETQRDIFTLNATAIGESLAARDSGTAEFAADNANIQSLLNAAKAIADASILPLAYVEGTTAAEMIAFEEAVAALDHCALEMQQKSLIHSAAKVVQAAQALFAIATPTPADQRALLEAALAIEGIATDQIPLETTTKRMALSAAVKRIANMLESGLINAVRKEDDSKIIPLQKALSTYKEILDELKSNPQADNDSLLNNAQTAASAFRDLAELNPPPTPQLTAPVENPDMRTLDALNAPASSAPVIRNGYTQIPESASAQFNAQARPTVFAHIGYDPTLAKNAHNTMRNRKQNAAATQTITSTPANNGPI